MKKVILTMLVVALITACSKDDNSVGDGIPEPIQVYFDLLKSDGTAFEEGEILYNEGFYNYDEEWKLVWDSWIELNKNEHPVSEGVFFGPSYFYPCDPEGYPEVECVQDRYYLLKYSDTEIIDTIVVRERGLGLEYRYFEFFLNRGLIYSYDAIHAYVNEPEEIWKHWIITLNKEEF